MNKLRRLILNWWCERFHGGGYIDRDRRGAVTWRCRCGRALDDIN